MTSATLFATHYHELTELADSKERIQNYNIAVKEWNDNIIFLRKLVEGGTNRSYGIQVARLAGIPIRVVKRAKKILFEIENREESAKSLPVLTQSDQKDNAQELVDGHVQLGLFGSPENEIVDHLLKLDITNLTPLEALNYLNELKSKAAKGLQKS